MVGPRDVRVIADRPSDARLLGEGSVACERVRIENGLDDALLADVDCTRERLTWALRERAADVGGSALAELECVELGAERRCKALVLRLPAPIRSNLPGLAPEQSRRTDEPRVSDAWQIVVDFERAGSRSSARAVSADLVEQRVELPLDHRLLGRIVTRCSGECPLESVREGVRTAAGRAGARSISEVQCVTSHDHQICSGNAGAPERPPELDPRSH
jgi:hypothetical protein